MLKIRLVVITMMLAVGATKAQNIDVGLQLGAAFYDGDLSMPKYFDNLSQANPAFGALVRAQILPGTFLRGGFVATKVEAYDAKADEPWRQERNLSFESKIFETTILLELHPLKWSKATERFPVSPYVFGGMGFFKFNPQASYNGDMVDLQPLGTEGQGMPGYGNHYELRSLVAPFGLGFRYEIGRWSIDLEYGWRRTNTDYLDDISANYVAYNDLLDAKGAVAAQLGNKVDAPTGKQRGNDKVKDWYSIPVLTVAYRLSFENSGYISGSKGKKAMNCPSF